MNRCEILRTFASAEFLRSGIRTTDAIVIKTIQLLKFILIVFFFVFTYRILIRLCFVFKWRIRVNRKNKLFECSTGLKRNTPSTGLLPSLNNRPCSNNGSGMLNYHFCATALQVSSLIFSFVFPSPPAQLSCSAQRHLHKSTTTQ